MCSMDHKEFYLAFITKSHFGKKMNKLIITFFICHICMYVSIHTDTETYTCVLI